MDGRGFPQDLPWASPLGNPLEQPCQPSENPVHPSSFTWINPIYRQNTHSSAIMADPKYKDL